MTAIARLRSIWPLITLLGSASLLAGAHAFQRFGGLAPCPLCLDQRNWHWGVVAASAIGLAVGRSKPTWGRGIVLFVGLLLLGSFAQAAYHVAVEQHWVVAQCDARINVNDLRPLDFEGAVFAPKCDEIAWSMLGVSMAGYNAIISLALALASFAVAAPSERKS